MAMKYKYDKIAELMTDGNAKLTKYKSLNSGITICIANVNGPTVGGFFVFATEAHDNDGLPHTLEHLVFLGSEKYPYKGVLDMIANKCMSQGTNAWTDIDHTCYTLSTAGYEGFLKLLPIYLDHLLFPVLSHAAYVTEVHHINGDGEDAGVVYSEMQARVNSGENLSYLEMLRLIYPGHCGYKSETGGLLENLRERTSHERVRAYHKEFYRPENLCLIIAGDIEAEQVFEALVSVEDRLCKEDERPKFIRPWESPVPPLLESVTKVIEYPTDEDEYGLVLAAWRGPLANDFINMVSIQILLDYLTDTSVSPFSHHFIEIDDPLCNDVDYSVIENSESCMYLHFSNVPISKLEELKDKALLLLKDIAEGKEEIDMQRMRNLVKKKKLYILSSMENNPHDALANCLIGDFLYGSSVEDLEKRLQEIPVIDKLLTENVQFWIRILKKYLVDGKHAIILGTPSAELAKKMAKEEKERIKQQRDKLGPDGLKEKAKCLKEATEANEVPPPKEIMNSISVSSVKSIKFHPIKRKCSIRESEGDQLMYSMSKMPCRFEVDHIQTKFVHLFTMIDTSGLSIEDRMYLPLLIELFDECAINRDGKLVPYSDVVMQLAEDTVSISAALGFGYKRFFCTNFSQTLVLHLMVEEEKYETSVQWVKEILYQIHLEPARIKSGINKMITDIPSIKESGNCVTKSMMKNLIYRPESNHWTSSVFRQHKFLLKLLKQLETSADSVIEKLNEIRNHLFKPDQMVIHLATNLDSLKTKVNPEDVWVQKFLPPSLEPCIMSSNFKKCCEYLQPFSGDGIQGLIAGLGSVETSFLLQATACPITQDHPDYAPLMLLTSYLSMSEGPMYRQIRGSGLAYSYGIWCNSDAGLLYFSLYKASQLFKAYDVSMKIVDSYLNRAVNWDIMQLDCARYSLISETIEKMKTVGDVISQSVLTYCRGSYSDFTKKSQELIEKITKVTTSDIERVGMTYLKPLFNPELSRCTVTCNPSKVDELVEAFKKYSRYLTVVPSLDDNFMSKF